MVAYSFKARFAPKILDGSKDQTIRGERLNGHAAPGDPLQIYQGQRTKACCLILRTHCVETVPIHFVLRPVVEIVVDREKLDVGDLDAFARRDGFDDLDDMLRFWTEQHGATRRIFDGAVIRWPAHKPERSAA